jgi:type III secretion system YscI/HrpB-like protein
MNIDPTMIAQTPSDRTDPGLQSPAPGDVAAFSAAMGARIQKPEQAAVEALQRTEGALLQKVGEASRADLRDVRGTLGLQTAMLDMRTDVDVIAKVAGVVTQAINKLTSMQ